MNDGALQRSPVLHIFLDMVVNFRFLLYLLFFSMEDNNIVLSAPSDEETRLSYQ